MPDFARSAHAGVQRQLDRLAAPVEASRVRVTVASSLDVPRLGTVALYRSPA